MNKKQAIFATVAGMAMTSMMLVGCGSSNTTAPTTNSTTSATSQPQSDKGTTASKSTATDPASSTTGTAKPATPGSTAPTSATPQAGQAPAPAQNQTPPGKYGNDMNKVVQAIFTDSRVTQMTAGQKGQLGVVFAGGAQGAESAPVDGKWNVQLTVDQKPIANIVVSESDFKVLSVTASK